MTGIYLEDNPPARRQFRDRLSQPTGCFVIHTAESNADEVGPDSGAENVAHFIRTRSTPGSYHRLCDSDSIVKLVRFSKAAYGDGTGSNEFAIHISAACSAHQWDHLSPEWRRSTVRNMAKAAAEGARWLRNTRGIRVPAKRITREESERGLPGFISHGERDPGRRSDPGASFPWALFLQFFDEEMNPGGTPGGPHGDLDAKTPRGYRRRWLLARKQRGKPRPGKSWIGSTNAGSVHLGPRKATQVVTASAGHVDALGIVEAFDVDVADALGPDWDVAQDRSTPARAGSAFAIRKEHGRILQARWRKALTPTIRRNGRTVRFKMRTRWELVCDVQFGFGAERWQAEVSVSHNAPPRMRLLQPRWFKRVGGKGVAIMLFDSNAKIGRVRKAFSTYRVTQVDVMGIAVRRWIPSSKSAVPVPVAKGIGGHRMNTARVW